MNEAWNRPPRTRSRWAGFALLLPLWACGEDAGEPAASEPQAAPDRPGATPALDTAHPERVFTDRPAERSPRLGPMFEEAEEGTDSWATEPQQESARGWLAGRLTACLRPGSELPLAEGLDTPPLRPPARRVLREEAHLRVERAVDVGELQAVDAQEALAPLRELFEGAEEVRCEVEVVASRPLPGDELETDALVTLFGQSEGTRVQVDGAWRLRWRLEGGEPVEPLDLLILDHEEVHATGAFFADLTRHVLGDHLFFRREFLLGVDDLYRFRDNLGGSPFIGSQGIAIGDVNGDGRDDLFVGQPVGEPCRLFIAQPDGTAIDQAQEANLAILETVRSALLVDLDNDGDQDIALAVGPTVAVAWNDGSGVFSGLVVLPAEGPDNVFSLCAADPDGDGDLDLYATRYVQNGARGNTVPTPYHDANNGSSNVLWRNEGERRFSDATAELGLDQNNQRFSLAAIWDDLDLDGDLDLYVSNDFGQNNLYRNEGGRFEDVAEATGTTDMAAGMGTTVADHDLDGDLDLYVSNMFAAAGMRVVGLEGGAFMPGEDSEIRGHYLRHARGNTLLVNRGDGTFEDRSVEAGVARAGWSWGGLFTDLDGDGWEDLHVANGFITGWEPGETNSFYWRGVTSRSPLDPEPTEDYVDAWTTIEHLVMREGQSWSGHERDASFLNARDGSFVSVGAVAGLDFLQDSRAVARVDWNDDGRQDLVVKSRTAPRLRLLLNTVAGHGHFLALDLRGVRCNRDGIGAHVVIELEGRTLRRTLHAGSGYLSQSSKRMLFGLGDETRVRSVEVRWPDGSVDRHEDLAGDSRYLLAQGAAAPQPVEAHTAEGLEQHAAPLAADPDAAVDRIPLVERMPVPGLPLPSFKTPTRTLGDLAGRPALVTLHSATSPTCREELERLSRATDLQQAGLQVVPMLVDPEAQHADGRALLAEYGLASQAGPLTESTRLTLEVLLSGLFGRTTSTPLPTSFLLDSRGAIAVVYLGTIKLPQLRRDVAILVTEPADTTRGDALRGGFWFVPPRRSYSRIVRALSMLGQTDLARHFRALRRKDD